MDRESQRLSFGAAAGTYDAHRPDWPADTAAWLIGSRRGPLDVLDLGAGTGKLTATLVAAGHRVTAVDPSEGMLEVLGERLPEVRRVRAGAEEVPLPAAELDAITVAQAWHWFDAAAAAAECARLLRPGGTLGIGWHLRDVDVEWVAELNDLTGDPATTSEESVRHLRTNLELPSPFGPVEHRTFRYDLELTPAGLAAVAATWSYVALRDDRDDVLAAVEKLGRRVADRSGRLVLPHVTHCHRGRRDAG